MNTSRAITSHVAGEFLAWIAVKRDYSKKLFRITTDLEIALQDRWRREEYADNETLTDLCLATYHRERLERWLNILDFGAQYGINFQSPERKRLFQKWLQTSTTH